MDKQTAEKLDALTNEYLRAMAEYPAACRRMVKAHREFVAAGKAVRIIVNGATVAHRKFRGGFKDLLQGRDPWTAPGTKGASNAMEAFAALEVLPQRR